MERDRDSDSDSDSDHECNLGRPLGWFGLGWNLQPLPQQLPPSPPPTHQDVVVGDTYLSLGFAAWSGVEATNLSLTSRPPSAFPLLTPGGSLALPGG